MKKINLISVFFVMLFLIACSNNEKSSKETSKEKEEETTSKETATKESDTDKSENTENESKSDSEESLENEQYPVQPGYQLNGREKVLYENKNGKITFLGETVDTEGHLIVAVQHDGELIYSKNNIEYTVITSESEPVTLSTDSNNYGYRFSKDKKIYIMRSDDPVSGTPLRMDYNLISENEDEDEDVLGDEIYEDEDEEKSGETIQLEETDNKITIPDLMEVPFYDKELNLTRKDENKEIKLTGAYIVPDEPNKVRITATATYKKDTDGFGASYVRPVTNYREYFDIETTAYAGIPLDFDFITDLDSILGDDEGSILYISIDDFLFPIDLRTGKEYTGNIKLIHLPTVEPASTNNPTVYGTQDNDGNLIHNAIISDGPTWNYGIDTKEKETVQFISGGIFKELNVDIATGTDFKNNKGKYNIYFYDDKFETVQDTDEIKGTILYQSILKSDSKSVNETIDLDGINMFTFYYNTNRLSSNGSGNENLINVLLANGELKR